MSLVLLGILNSQAAGVSAGAYDLLETQVLASSAASVTFTGLGSYTDYKHLQIRAVVRSVRTSVSNDQMLIRLNNDSTTSYAYHQLEGTGSTVSSFAGTSDDEIRSGMSAVDSESSGIFGATVIDILDFADTSKNTTIRGLTGVVGSYKSVRLQSGLFAKTGAVTEIDIDQFGTEFVAGSRFSLYGIKAA